MCVCVREREGRRECESKRGREERERERERGGGDSSLFPHLIIINHPHVNVSIDYTAANHHQVKVIHVHLLIDNHPQSCVCTCVRTCLCIGKARSPNTTP